MPRFRLPQFLTRTASPHSTVTAPAHRYEGFTKDGRVALRDRRGTAKAKIPNVDTKSETLGSDPLAIYKPTGSKGVDAAKAMANFTGWTFVAVNAIGSEVANIQLRLYSVSGDDHKELDDHELLTLLDTVNGSMTGIELKYVTMAHLELTGNCFLLLDGVTSGMSKPRGIYPLNPGSVHVKLNKDSFPYTLDHYEYTLDGSIFKFQPYQVLHIISPDPNDPFAGIGIPQTIPSWIDSDNYVMEYNRKFFINGAQVGLFIRTEMNVEGNIDRIRKRWANRQEGIEGAHKVLVLPKGVELKHTGVTHKDMDFGNLASETRDRILAAFRVSKTILGMAESDTNRATRRLPTTCSPNAPSSRRLCSSSPTSKSSWSRVTAATSTSPSSTRRQNITRRRHRITSTITRHALSTGTAWTRSGWRNAPAASWHSAKLYGAIVPVPAACGARALNRRTASPHPRRFAAARPAAAPPGRRSRSARTPSDRATPARGRR
jgi:HK97 family phage portal protein